MTTLVIERSTDVQSVAWIAADGSVTPHIMDGADCRSGDWVVRVQEFLDGRRPDRIVVGTGPGSFAGIRAALAFAQGYALGSTAEVYGLPSPCALAGDSLLNLGATHPCVGNRLAVIGDARRGLFWVALFEGTVPAPIFQVTQSDLTARVPAGIPVVSPDAKRIGDTLQSTFGDAYHGPATPTAEGLAHFLKANPSVLTPEPLPIYLNPAVR